MLLKITVKTSQNLLLYVAVDIFRINLICIRIDTVDCIVYYVITVHAHNS